MSENDSLDGQGERKYHLFGVPLRSGSHYPGSENDAQAYRDVGIVECLAASGCQIIDEGDIAIPSYLPHHHVPPIKNWPGPRIAWECVSAGILPSLQQPGHIPFLIGGDCSMVVGSTQALMKASERFPPRFPFWSISTLMFEAEQEMPAAYFPHNDGLVSQKRRNCSARY